VEFVTTPAEDTAEGRLLLNVSGVVAEFEREKIRERTSRGKKEKARQGLYVQPHACPFGYRPRSGAARISHGQRRRGRDRPAHLQDAHRRPMLGALDRHAASTTRDSLGTRRCSEY
jgi:DNA invertase Pin-like site-specific DNA recombinase